MQTNEFEKIFTAFWIRKNKKNNNSHNVIRYINLGGKKYVFKHPTKADSTISIVNEVIASIILKAISTTGATKLTAPKANSNKCRLFLLSVNFLFLNS